MNPHGLPRQILSLMRLPFRHSRTHRCACMTEQKWSRCRDLNPGPLGPEPSALPNCATPRPRAHIRHTHSIEHGSTRVKRFPPSVFRLPPSLLFPAFWQRFPTRFWRYDIVFRFSSRARRLQTPPSLMGQAGWPAARSYVLRARFFGHPLSVYLGPPEIPAHRA